MSRAQQCVRCQGIMGPGEILDHRGHCCRCFETLEGQRAQTQNHLAPTGMPWEQEVAGRFVTLCRELRELGATEVVCGDLRAVFTPLAPTQLLDLPRPNSPRVPKAETRIQREDRMRREEEERRAKELRSVGGGG